MSVVPAAVARRGAGEPGGAMKRGPSDVGVGVRVVRVARALQSGAASDRVRAVGTVAARQIGPSVGHRTVLVTGVRSRRVLVGSEATDGAVGRVGSALIAAKELTGGVAPVRPATGDPARRPGQAGASGGMVVRDPDGRVVSGATAGAGSRTGEMRLTGAGPAAGTSPVRLHGV